MENTKGTELFDHQEAIQEVIKSVPLPKSPSSLHKSKLYQRLDADCIYTASIISIQLQLLINKFLNVASFT